MQKLIYPQMNADKRGFYAGVYQYGSGDSMTVATRYAAIKRNYIRVHLRSSVDACFLMSAATGVEV